MGTFLEKIMVLFWTAKYLVRRTFSQKEVATKKFIGLLLAVPPIMFLLYLVVDGLYWYWQVSAGVRRPDDSDTIPAWVIFLALILALVETFSIFVVPASYQPAISYALLVVVLLVLPKGVAGLLEKKWRTT